MNAVRRKRPKNGKPTVGAPSWHCSSTPFGLGQGFLSKEQCDNTAASPLCSWPGFSWHLLVPLAEISIKGTVLLWCYWYNFKCDGRAEKAFIKWLSGMFPTTLESPAEQYSCKWGLFLRKCSLNCCTVLHFSEIKWFLEHFESTMYTHTHTHTQQTATISTSYIIEQSHKECNHYVQRHNLMGKMGLVEPKA